MKKIVALFVLSIFAGCALYSGLNPANLTDNQARANFANSTFLSAWADYQYCAALPNLKPEAKELLVNKRLILASMIDPLFGPMMRFNNLVETGEVVSDADWNLMLEKLLGLGTGWYTEASSYVANPNFSTFAINREYSDGELREELQKAGLLKPEAKARAIWEGILLELIRTSIHALRAMLAQRGYDEVQMAAAWKDSWSRVKALNVNDLVVIN